jgi:hypothetical protein
MMVYFTLRIHATQPIGLLPTSYFFLQTPDGN